MSRPTFLSNSLNRTLIGCAAAGLSIGVSSADVEQSLVLEEVLVTAQRKSESLAEAPLTVNVVSGQQIKAFTIFDATEISKLTSGVEIRNEGDSNTGMAIRGVGTLTQQATEARVGIYLDDWYGGAQTQFVFNQMFDISRVQILRGPQGTLYGQPSPTGAMILETTDPNLTEVDGFISASYQNPQGYNLQTGISIPLIENKLGLRIAGLLDERETGLENGVRNLDNQINNSGFRVKALWQPNDEFTAKLGWTYVESEDSETYRPVESITESANYQVDANDRLSIQDAPDQLNKREDDLYTLHLNWNPGPVEVKFFAGYHKPEVDSSSDEDVTDQPLQTVAVSGEGTEGQQFELRVIAAPFDWWDTQIGAYYAETGNDALATVFAAAGPAFSAALRLFIPTDNKVSALFTHNDFHISDYTTITAGLRYNEFDNSVIQSQTTELWFGSQLLPGGDVTEPSSILSIPCADGSAPPCNMLVEESLEKWTGTLKISHAFSDGYNLYATYDHGFRPGTGNFDISGSTGGDLLTYDGESVDSVEFGLKGSLMNGRAQYTFAAFYAVYEDYQINPSFQHWSAQLGEATDINIVYVNVDEAVQYGLEGEFRMLITENWSMFTSLGWNQVEFTDGVVPCNDPTQATLSPTNLFNVCDADGEAASAQPDWSWVLQSEYWRPLDIIQGEWYVNGLFNYRGDADHPGDPLGRLAVDGYYQLDLFAGVRNDNWTAQIFVKNAFDDNEVVSRRALGQDYNDISLITPRIAGLTVGYRF